MTKKNCTFYLNSCFYGKMVNLKKIEVHLPKPPSTTATTVQPPTFNLKK